MGQCCQQRLFSLVTTNVIGRRGDDFQFRGQALRQRDPLMRHTDELHTARLADHATASTHLALLGDRRLGRLVDGATPMGSGIGGSTAVLDIEGVKVFVKKVPLTEVERRPENVMSTSNLFGLPTFYQYGLGSAGFGAWRELAVHAMTTNWVLRNEYQGFPLMHHWRVLSDAPSAVTGLAEFGGLDGAVEHWDGSPAVRSRLEAIRDSTVGIVLFLEYFPQTLGAWLADQDPVVYLRVDEALADGAAFMRAHGLVHFDAHFNNILTDGRHLYFSDFGLALSSRFELSTRERDFLSQHRDYDAAYVATHLLVHYVADSVRGNRERSQFLRDWTEGNRPEGVSAPAASILTSHARTATVMSDFHRRLQDESKKTAFPASAIERCRATKSR
jgi:hypothetical protein